MRGGGKGPLIQTEKSGTLSTNNDQTLFIMKETFYEAHSQDARYKEVDISPSLTSSMDNQTDVPLVHVYDNHPSDSRVTESKDVCSTLTSKMGTGGGNVPFVLMDQGGGVMSIEHDKVGTLRAQEHGHQPIIMTGGFTGISEKVSPTIVAGMSHQSGTTQPIVFGKVSRPRGKDGLGERWDEIDVASTRNCMDIGDSRAQEVVTYRIDSDASNAMQSSNPNSGVHKVSISPTLDTTISSPAKGQGGVAICIPINTMNCQGRPSDNGRMGLGIGNDGDPSPTITKAHGHAVCIAENVIGRKVENGGNGIGAQEDISYTLNATGVHGVSNAGQVRRLTPVECERLQGFHDNWTRIPYRGKPAEDCPDSPRYKAIGNSWAVPCVRWIGRRIDAELREAQVRTGPEPNKSQGGLLIISKTKS